MNVTDSSLTVDHIDSNKLNNLRSNLRICTQKLNCCNRSKGEGKYSSSFKGVFKNKTMPNRWCAKIKVDGKNIYLGTFIMEPEAAEAYNNAAIKFFGEYAKVNII